MLNTRAIHNHPELAEELALRMSNPQLRSLPGCFRNKNRFALNWRTLRQTFYGTPKRLLTAPAAFSNLPLEDIPHLYAMHDQNFGGGLPILPLVIGMPVRITAGQYKGSCGTLVAFAFPRDTQSTEEQWFGIQCQHQSTPPSLVYVELLWTGDASSKPCLPCNHLALSDDPAAFVLALEPFRFASNSSLHLSEGTRRTVAFKQAPIVPNFASSIHGLQGFTLDTTVAVDLHHHHEHMALYVLASRVRKLEGLFLVRSLTEDDAKFYTPPEHIRDTLASFEQKQAKALQDFHLDEPAYCLPVT